MNEHLLMRLTTEHFQWLLIVGADPDQSSVVLGFPGVAREILITPSSRMSLPELPFVVRWGLRNEKFESLFVGWENISCLSLCWSSNPGVLNNFVFVFVFKKNNLWELAFGKFFSRV